MAYGSYDLIFVFPVSYSKFLKHIVTKVINLHSDSKRILLNSLYKIVIVFVLCLSHLHYAKWTVL